MMNQAKRSGDTPFVFAYRDDLRVLPAPVLDHEVNLHGSFATDRRAGSGPLYYGMPGSGILRIDPDLKRQTLIRLPATLEPLNFHSTRLGQIDGQQRLILAANDGALVAVVGLDGGLDFVLSRPEFEAYEAAEAVYAPTDTVLVGEQLYVADGYGSNYISSADVNTQQWVASFGGETTEAQEDGKFGRAHGITHSHAHPHLVIADRKHSRLQEHALDGGFVASHALPAGSRPCGLDLIRWQDRWLAAVGSLDDPEPGRPAPIYILDADTFTILSTVRPAEDLGLDQVQHLHNVVWHIWDDQLYLVCQSWNPGFYFVLELV